MAIDAGIYQLAGRGVKSVADYDKEAAQVKQNKLAEMMSGMKMDEYKRGVEDQNQLRNVSAQFGADSAKNTNALYQAGLFKQAGDYAKSQGEIAKTNAAAQKDQLANAHSKISLGAQLLSTARDQASYDASRAEASANGLDVSRMPAQFDPAFVASKMQESQTIKEQLEQKWKAMEYTTPNANSRLQADTSIATNKLTNDTSRLNNQETNQTSRANNQATIGQAERSSLRSDARSRESTAATISKPFEVTGEDGKPVLVQQDKQGNIRPVQGYSGKSAAAKPLTEGQAKAVAFASRMENSNKIIDDLAKAGREVSVPGSRAGYGVGNVISALQPDKAQQLDQAKRDFINAVLRRESGAVISDAEFSNAEKQYFPQINEGDGVKANKSKNRRIALEGMKADIPASMGNMTGDIINKAGGGKPSSNIDSLLDKYK